MSISNVWNNATPDNSDYAYEVDDFIRALKTDIDERMEVEHIWAGNDDDATHSSDGQHQRGRTRIVYVGAREDFPTALRGALACSTDESFKLYVATADGTWTAAAVETALTSTDVDAAAIANHIASTAADGHDGIGLHTHQSTSEGGNITSRAIYSYDSAHAGSWTWIEPNETIEFLHEIPNMTGPPRILLLYLSNSSNPQNGDWVLASQPHDEKNDSQCQIIAADSTKITVRMWDRGAILNRSATDERKTVGGTSTNGLYIRVLAYW